MSEAEIEEQRKVEEAQLYVNTNNSGMKKIEVLGVQQAYKWRTETASARDIALQSIKISDVGEPGMLRETIGEAMNLYLEGNLLHSWDQYFQIIKQLDFLRLITLTGNRFEKIDEKYLEGKNTA